MRRIKIFISSVQSEFVEERRMLKTYISTDALLSSFFDVFIFEDMPAYEETVQTVYLQEVSECDIYIGLLGNLYGYEDSKGISPTEREYDEATKLHKSRLIFIKSIYEDTRHPKEAAFVKKVEQDIVRKTFIDNETLRYAIYSSLVRYLQDREYIHSKAFDASPVYGAALDDIDEEVVHSFLLAARRRRGFSLSEGASTTDVLRHLGLMTKDGNLSSAAILLFGKDAQRYFISSEVKCAQFYGNEVERPAPSYQIFKGNVFQLVTQATSFIMSRIDNWVGVRSVPGTASVPTRSELPLEAVQEAVVNAICHRDYRSNGSVQVMLFRNRLEIWNPGLLPTGITIKELYTIHPSIPVNPLIAEAMYLNGYVEKIGSGTQDIVRKCKGHGLKEPFYQQGNIFKVTIWRAEYSNVSSNVSSNTDNVSSNTDNVSSNADSVSSNADSVSSNADNVSFAITGLPSEIIVNILSCIDKNPSSRKAILLNAGLSYQSYNINRYIKPLIEDGLIRSLNRKVNKESRKDFISITEKGIQYLNILKKSTQ